MNSIKNKIKYNKKSSPDSFENQSVSFQYDLLGRLKTDCEYFLGNGNGYEKHLWAGSVKGQIEKMKTIHDSLKVKPKWLPKRKIKMYETLMTRKLQSKN